MPSDNMLDLISIRLDCIDQGNYFPKRCSCHTQSAEATEDIFIAARLLQLHFHESSFFVTR